MKNLATLVRLHKWRIDESTRKLADLDSLATRLRGQITDIGDGLAAEAPLAAASVESAASYSSFLQVEIGRRRTLEHSLVDLEQEIVRAREQIAAAYSELKAYEITLERKRKHATRMRDRRQQSLLDEIGQTLSCTRAGERLV